MKHSLALAAVSVLSLAGLAACGSDDGGGGGAGGSGGGGAVQVVASTNVWGDVARSVGGEAVEVTSVIHDAAQDPHGFEADSETLLTVSEADVVVENGGGYDDFMDSMIDSSDTDAAVVNAFDVSGKADAAPEGEEVNEHVWYDVPTVGKVATQIADALAEADPDNAQTYRDNATALQGRLDGLTADEETMRTSVQGRPVGLTEPLPVYLIDALGLEDRTPEEFAEAVEEGEDVPVAVTQDVLGQVREGGIDLLFYNDQTTTPVTEEVRTAAEKAGVPVVPVSELLPEGQDYVAWMQANLDAVAAALNAA